MVECGDTAMTLTVRRRRAAQLLLDRGEAAASMSGTVRSTGAPFTVEHSCSVKLHLASYALDYHLSLEMLLFSKAAPPPPSKVL